MSDYRTNHFWAVDAPANLGWDDFTCPTCRACADLCPRCGRKPTEVCLVWECVPQEDRRG